jgi:hypothetical protein
VFARGKFENCGNCATCHLHRAPHLLEHGGKRDHPARHF